MIETLLPIPESAILVACAVLCLYMVHELLYYRPLFFVRRHSHRSNKNSSLSPSPSPSLSVSHNPLLFSQKIGHRGCRLDGLPENSLAAFRHALRHNADVLELDVWLSKDGRVVVFHDKTVGRMTVDPEDTDRQRESQRDREPVHIYDLAYDELPSLRTDIPGQCEQIHLYSSREVTKIPTLEEVIDILPWDKGMNVEIKQDSQELFRKVLEIVTKAGKKHQIYWFSLEEKINKQLRSFDSTIPNIVSVEGVLKNLALYYMGVIPFMDIPEQVYCITVEKISLEKLRNERAIADIPDILKQVLAFLLQGHPPHLLVCPKFFTHLRRRGIPVWFLNVQTEAELEVAVKAGATGVLTDRIEWLNETMTKRKLRFKGLYE